MGPRSIRVLAVLSTLLVLAGGALVNRDIFLERSGNSVAWVQPVLQPGTEEQVEPVLAPPEPTNIVVDAGDGVRVHVEGQTGTAGVVWGTRAWFAHAEVLVSDGAVAARCHAPTPVSRCAIWVSVTTATAQDTVHILERPGAITGDLPANVTTTVERVG